MFEITAENQELLVVNGRKEALYTSVPVKVEVKEYMALDIDKTCRICLEVQEEDNLYSLYGTNEYFSSISFATAIDECFGVLLHKDGNLPSLICSQCAISTLQACTFKSTMLNSEHTINATEIEQLASDEKVESAGTRIFPSPKYEELYRDNEEGKVLSISFEHSYSLGMEKTDLKRYNNQSVPDSVTSYDQQYMTENVHSSANMGENKIQLQIDKLEVKNVSTKEEPSINNVTDITNHYDASNKWWLIDFGLPYECRICNCIFDQYAAFYSHVHNHFIHSSICIQCGIKFPFGKLKHHKCTQNENDYICIYCLIIFSTAEDLGKHLLSHLDEKLFLCEICGQEFNENNALEAHKRHHIRIGVPQFICEYCGKTFMGLQGYKKHKQKFHLNTVPHGETHKCDQCKKVFSNSKSLIQHYKTHSNKVENLKCEICDSTFMMSFSYNVHMFLHKVKMSTFNSMSFNCEFCFDMFTNKEAFEKHLLNHIEKPYQCNQCHKFFSSKMKVKQHLIHHSEERPYSCEYCSKTFKNPTTLYQHKKIHIGKRPYVCKVCSRSFIQQQQLTSHMFTHTGEKKYVCQYCGKAFALNGNLTVHIRRHTGDTPFHCRTCGKGFYDSSTLKKHTVWKHKL